MCRTTIPLPMRCWRVSASDEQGSATSKKTKSAKLGNKKNICYGSLFVARWYSSTSIGDCNLTITPGAGFTASEGSGAPFQRYREMTHTKWGIQKVVRAEGEGEGGKAVLFAMATQRSAKHLSGNKDNSRREGKRRAALTGCNSSWTLVDRLCCQTGGQNTNRYHTFPIGWLFSY